MLTERFELRVSVEIIRRLDEWRRSQEDLPSRGEAIRRFVEQGLRRAAREYDRQRPLVPPELDCPAGDLMTDL